MKALVIGGTGGMGQGVARDLIKQEQIASVTLGDINIDPARVQEKLRASNKVSLKKIDVQDHSGLVAAIKGVDVVINCAGPFYKTAVAVARAMPNAAAISPTPIGRSADASIPTTSMTRRVGGDGDRSTTGRVLSRHGTCLSVRTAVPTLSGASK